MRPTKLTAALAAISVCSVATNAPAEDIAKHMHQHQDAMIAVQRAIIAGSLAGTHESARWLLEHEEPAGLPESGAAFIAAMREAASGVLEADSLEVAAEAASHMGRACGSCHTANSVTVEFDDVKKPSDKENQKAHMQRHLWAADRMWEGLIGPSPSTWHRGADLLFESPVKPQELAKHGGGEETVTMSRRIHQLSANATSVTDPEEQREIYAEFIANCGSCHRELGKKVD